MAVCPTCKTSYNATVRICPADGTPLPLDAAPDPNLGSLLEGKYRIDAFISAGGMGSVYRGTHVMLDKPVAIKLIRKELVTAPDIGTRFQREARAASNLGHPNIAAVSDFGQTADGTLYLVMEFIKGSSLRDVIQQGGPMAPDRIISILQPIAAALARAHRQHIIHRDLKPHNIMLDVDADGVVTPKLLDFGIAKTFDDSASQLTMTGFALGTPQYMSPEQATGKQVDGRSDLYSLGVVLYEMLIGEVPFSDTSLAGILLKQMTETPLAPSVRRPDLSISPSLEAIAMRCLEKDPANRFQSADELSAALDRARAGAQTESPTVRMAAPGVPQDNDATRVMTPQAAATTPHAPAPHAPTPPPVPPPLPPPRPAPMEGTSPTVPAAAQPAAALPSPTSGGSNRFLIPAVAVVALIALVAGVLGLRQSDTASNLEPVSATTTLADAPPAATTPASSGAAALSGPSGAPGASADAVAPRDATRPASGAPSSTPAAERPSVATGAAAAPPQPSAAPARPATPAGAQAPAAPATPANPTVFVECSGPGEVCSPMRAAFSEAATRDHMTLASSAGRADVVLSVTVEIVEERQTQSFGTTFVTRSYSADVEGESKGSVVPMPSGRTFSFDANVGRERAAENARLLASDAVDKVRAFWDARR